MTMLNASAAPLRAVLVLAATVLAALASPAAAGDLAGATVAVQAVTPTPDGRARVSECTGALIAADLVLTAGHCLDGVDRPAYVAVFAYDGASPRSPHVGVVRFSRHPAHVVGWRQRPGDPATRQAEIAADMALLKLASPIRAAAPVTLASDPYAAASSTGAVTGTGRDGSGPAAKSGRMKSLRASAVRLSTGSGARVGFASASATVCGGDSGGPVAGASGEVWGVVAAVLQAKGGCGRRVAVAPVDPRSDGFRRMRAALD